MKVYYVSACIGGIISQIGRFVNHEKAIDYVKKHGEQGVFFIVDANRFDEDTNTWSTLSDIFFDSIRVASLRRKATVDDIYELEKTLPRVYHPNGTISLLPSAAITTPECYKICGGWFHVAVVNDDLPRMSIIFPDEKYAKSKPLNRKATKLFGRELRGDVIYINENFT